MENKLDRREVVSELLKERGDLLVVAGLGAPAYDVAAAGNGPTDFPLWGAMGGALMIGLGLALARPERNVVVITGDGELLMGMGSLATVAIQRPKNLRLVVLDNGEYGETGRQTTHTAGGTDLAAVAAGCGIEKVTTMTMVDELESLRHKLHHHAGMLVAVVKVRGGNKPRVLPPIDGPFLTHRIRAELLGEEMALKA